MKFRIAIAAVTALAVVGGGTALAQDNPDSNVENAEGTQGTEPLVIAGADRYETAAQIALSRQTVATDVLYIANGETLVDALVVGSSSGDNTMLLVRRDEVPAATLEALCEVDHAKLVFLGGDAVISPEVRDLVPNYTRNYATETGGEACN